MKQRPWPIVILAVIHALTPFGNFFLNEYRPEVSLTTYMSAFFQSPNIWNSICFLILPVLAGILIYLCKKWSLWTYIFIMSVILFQSYLNLGSPNNSGLPIPSSLTVLLNLVVVSYFLVPTVQKYYFNPALRWWETKPRFLVEYPAEIRWENKTFSGKVENISETGLFASVNGALPPNQTPVEVRFTDEVQEIIFHGHAINHSAPTKGGFGVSFAKSGTSNAAIKSFTKKLKSAGKRVTSRPDPNDSIFFWLKTVKRDPRNIFPK